MKKKMKRKMSTKKKLSLILTAFLIGALAIVGSLAWTDYTQTILNTFNLETDPEVLLHDDFDGENKDVYVENTGTTEIFVRVKFVEYLQLGSESLLPAYGTDSSTSTTKADAADKTTWPTHRFTTADKVDNECSLISHDYFIWNMSGNQRAYLAGVYDKDPYGRGGMTEEEFDALEIGVEFEHGDTTTKKMNTLDQSNPMMLSDWLLLEEKPAACWLLDTDGWAYWSAPLAADTATNLLLDSVEPTDLAFYDNGVYHIDVQLQAVNLEDLDHWSSNGIAEVANPDNSVATVTDNGKKFIMCMKGEDVTYSWVEVSDSNIYQAIKVNSITGTNTPTSNYKLAGNDGDITTEDDNNMLAGRSVANKGGIEIGTIDVTNKTYTIKNAAADYVVTMGIDNLLGTYDDVITSKTGALGQYDFDGDDSADNLGWNYLYGPLDNMLVATQYVLDNTMYNATRDENGYIYANSLVKEKMDELWTSFGAYMTATVNMVNGTDNNLDMSVAQHTGDYVYGCLTSHTHSDSCTNLDFGTYSTSTAAQSNIDLVNTKFFALSLNELLTAYGDSSTDTTILRNRAALYASKWSGNKKGTDFYADYGVYTTHYWLRTPSYYGTRIVTLDCDGNAYAVTSVTNNKTGVRPACYLNLSLTTTTE